MEPKSLAPSMESDGLLMWYISQAALQSLMLTAPCVASWYWYGAFCAVCALLGERAGPQYLTVLA